MLYVFIADLSSLPTDFLSVSVVILGFPLISMVIGAFLVV